MVWGKVKFSSTKPYNTPPTEGRQVFIPSFFEDYLTLGYSSAAYGEFLCLACESAECDDANLKFRSDLIIREGCQFVCNGSMVIQANSTIDVKDSSLETNGFKADVGKVILDNSTWTSTGLLRFYTGSIHLTNGSTMTTEGDVEFCNGSSFSWDYKVKLTIDSGCEYHSQGETKMGVYARLMYVEVDGLLHNSGELLRFGSPYTGIRCFLNVNDGGEWRSDGPVSYIWGDVSINEGGTWTSNDEVQVGYFSEYEPADDVFAELNVDGGTWTANGPVTFGNPSGRNFGVQLTASNGGTVAFNDEVVCDTRTHFILDGGDIFANAGLELTGSDDEDYACTITGHGDFYLPGSTLTLGENTSVVGDDTENCRIRFRQGTLSGIGSLKNVVLKNIDVTPGDGIGTMAWDSVKMRDDAKLIMELAGVEAGTEYDQLLVSGNWILNGILEVLCKDGFETEAGDTFTIFALDDEVTINNSFDEIILPELSGDLEWDTSLLLTMGQISVVPEPATLCLLLAGSMMILLRRKQKVS